MSESDNNDNPGTLLFRTPLTGSTIEGTINESIIVAWNFMPFTIEIPRQTMSIYIPEYYMNMPHQYGLIYQYNDYLNARRYREHHKIQKMMDKIKWAKETGAVIVFRRPDELKVL